MARPVYQRGWVINSQLPSPPLLWNTSISKGMGDQFSADLCAPLQRHQYIKGDG